jgi:hypothetical protein
MGRINLGRVVIGGIVAGVVINIVEGVLNGGIMANQWAATMTSLNRSPTMSVKQIVAFNVWGFALGILTVWVYAAIRPRFGAGPKTAMCAGLLMWATACAMGTAGPVFLHIFRVDLALTATGVQLVEMLLASVAGCYFYKEDGVEQRMSSAARA